MVERRRNRAKQQNPCTAATHACFYNHETQVASIEDAYIDHPMMRHCIDLFCQGQDETGLRYAEPGNPDQLVFDPKTGTLEWAEGVFPHPRGPVRVRRKRGADGLPSNPISREPRRGFAVRDWAA